MSEHITIKESIMVNFKLSLLFVTLFSVYLCVQALECYSCRNCTKPEGLRKCSTNEVCAKWVEVFNGEYANHHLTRTMNHVQLILKKQRQTQLQNVVPQIEDANQERFVSQRNQILQ